MGLVIFAGLCLITWLAGALIRVVNNYFDRKAYGSIGED
jgi:uncharacterized membrane protein